MGIVDEQGKLVGHLYHFDTPLDLCCQQRFFNIFIGHAEMSADSHGGQRIVNAEFAGGCHLHVQIEQAFCPKCHAQFAGLLY